MTSTLQLQQWFSEATSWTDAVLPDYDGGSIANLPATILRAFNIDDHVAPPLLPALRSGVLSPAILAGARVVVLVVLDGLGVENLEYARRNGAVSWLDTASVSGEITSIFPSTTAAALTSIQTGLSPATHGLAGYTMYLEPQAATINSIGWKAVAGVKIARSMPDPATFLGVPNLYQRLEAGGIASTIVSPSQFEDSPLTNIQSAGVPYAGYRTLAEMAELVLYETRRPGRRFIYAYRDGFDTLAHTHGPDSIATLNEVYLTDQALGRGLLEPLTAQAQGDTAVLMVADHGHSAIARERTYSLEPVLAGRSAGRPIPTGDRRATGLPFDDRDGLTALQSMTGDDATVVSVSDAIGHGLFGPGAVHPDVASRVGKTLLISRGEAAFTYPQSSNPTAGGHGSLTRREMVVPLLAWRF